MNLICIVPSVRDVTDMSLHHLPCLSVLLCQGWVFIHPFELTEFSVLVMCNLQLVSAYEDTNTYTQCTGMIDVFKSCVLA